MTRKRKKGKKNNELHLHDVPREVWIGAGIVIALISVWFAVIRPIIIFVETNVETLIWIGAVLMLGVVVVILTYIGVVIKRKRDYAAFEKEQIAQGKQKFIDRHKKEWWGTPEEVRLWQQEDAEAREKERLINRVALAIGTFQPTQKYTTELPYQTELARHLQHIFTDTEIEKQRGSSRPDIVIGDLAIEIKGPTNTRDLQTVADKCMRYYQHFNELIIVLFDVHVNERRYKEWEQGIQNTFRDAKIVRK